MGAFSLRQCGEQLPDCFARTMDGKCLCLSDTDFKGKECPFYKPMADVDMIEYAEGIKDMAYGRPWRGYMPGEGKK